MLIGLFLVVGATSVFVNSRRSADIDDVIGQLQISGDTAMQAIEADVRMANYWGSAKDGAMMANKPEQLHASSPSSLLVQGTDAASCGAVFAVDTERYLEASNNVYSLPGSCSPRTEAAPFADTLTVRRVTQSTKSLDANKLQVCAQREQIEIILGTSCAHEIHDLVVNTYYVDKQSAQSPTYPSLRRKSLGSNSVGSAPGFRDQELVPGIEDLQVQFGWDPTGTAASTARYENPKDGGIPYGQIVAARVWLLVRAHIPDATYTNTNTYTYGDRQYTPNDHYRRLLLSRTIFVRNAVGT
jgi:Tfp pilus assembly protein PilW